MSKLNRMSLQMLNIFPPPEIRALSRALPGLLLACGLVLAAMASWQSPAEARISTKAKQALLLDADTGSVLFEKNADKLLPPASMSKLVTLAVVFEALKQGELSLDDQINFSVHAWRTGGAPSGTSAMMVPLNTSVSVHEIIQGIAVQSGNDACIAIAEALSGTEEAFAQRMTAYMRKIGLRKSTFGNSTGLPHPDQLMTARELALLAAHIIKTYPEYYHYFGQKEFKYRRHRFHNRNPLVVGYGADGLKTGYIKASGYGVVASVKKNDRRLIVVVGGTRSKRARKSEAIKLLSWGFRSFKQFELFDAGEEVARARVWGGEKMTVPLVGKGPVSIMMPRRLSSKRVPAKIVYKGPLKAPVNQGDKVAMLMLKNKSGSWNQVPLYAGADVKETTPFWRGIDSVLFMAFGWIP